MIRPLGALLLLSLTAVAHATPAVFRDETFADSDWTVVTSSFVVFENTVLPGGTATGAQVLTGGNPGSFRDVTHFVPAAPSPTTFAAVWSAHFRTGFVYDPSVQGPIATIDFDEDARSTLGSQLGQSTGIAIRQSDQVYVAQAGATPETAWTHKQVRGLAFSDFGVLAPNGFPGGSSPDFSAAGGPIEVGFVRGNSTGKGGGSYTIAAAIDNWQVRINPPCTTVPECDDGDACTIDDCVDGACSSSPLLCDDEDACTIDACVAGSCQNATLDCDDAADCTTDSCVAGVCQNLPTVSYASAETKALELLALLKGTVCDDDPVSKAFVRGLKKKIKKLGKRAGQLDDAAKENLIARLLGKASHLLDAADALVQKAVLDGKVSAPCAAVLQGFVDEVRQCIGT
jgi:hypothetical protein